MTVLRTELVEIEECITKKEVTLNELKEKSKHVKQKSDSTINDTIEVDYN